ncbi:MAG: hypothetical protein ABSE06_01150 [Anaerolineaceae bacterium]
MNSPEQRRPQFVHPAEEVFAKILDFYELEWQYEPHTFPLEWDEQGQVVEAFTPDFYLPDQDLYIELTTLRPKLANFKNRRIRRMQELYPEVHIKLIKRREMRELMVKYGLYENAEQIQGTAAQSRNGAPSPSEEDE